MWCVIETCVDIPGAQAFVISRHETEVEAVAAIASASQRVEKLQPRSEILTDRDEWESRDSFYGG